ncbi:MaoC family dehydratase [Oceanobacillus sp. FSL K6-0127]|uniref:MaoC family dehydratase n=1 Tax=Oceanobacillus sp. FSL K6-0127 TaxID=2921420 RepID=UPI0030EB6945
MCIRTNCKVILTEEKVKQYTLLSGDQNQIHHDEKIAKQYKYRQPIAHGMLIMGIGAALCSSLLESNVMISDYEMNFLQPVYVNDELQLIVEEKNDLQWLEVKGTVQDVQVARGRVQFQKADKNI